MLTESARGRGLAEEGSVGVAHPISFQLPASQALAGASCLLSGAHQQPHCQVLSHILAKGGTGLVPMA